jgi:hypothetical protein
MISKNAIKNKTRSGSRRLLKVTGGRLDMENIETADMHAVDAARRKVGAGGTAKGSIPAGMNVARERPRHFYVSRRVEKFSTASTLEFTGRHGFPRRSCGMKGWGKTK